MSPQKKELKREPIMLANSRVRFKKHPDINGILLGRDPFGHAVITIQVSALDTKQLKAIRTYTCLTPRGERFRHYICDMAELEPDRE